MSVENSWLLFKLDGTEFPILPPTPTMFSNFEINGPKVFYIFSPNGALSSVIAATWVITSENSTLITSPALAYFELG